MTADEAAQQCLDFIRKTMAQASGDELAVLDVFIDQIGSEVAGWEDRVTEINREEDQ